MLSAAELSQKVVNFSHNYFLIDMRHDRESFYALTEKDFAENPISVCGVVLNLFMDGELEQADRVIDSLPKNQYFDFIRLGIVLVHPKITFKEFIGYIEYLKKNNLQMPNVVLTAGRPSVLNGFNDFTRIGPLLQKYRQLFIDDLSCLYEKSTCPAIYNLCLAEYFYQLDKPFDAEVLVSRTIKEFDKDSERRLLFAALYLQAKILIAYGKTVESESYIKNIRRYVKKTGEAEFSYNIDSAQVMTSFYEGNYALMNRWIKKSAPDEYADFNMLDLYRYMVKVRCYIIKKNYSAAVALLEKLRPLLTAGKRHMDLCELDLLLAITLYRAEKKELAFDAFERALKIAKRRKYYRLIGDEGPAVLPLLIEFIKQEGKSGVSTDFLLMLLDIARSMAANHPLYLMEELKYLTPFSQKEIEILKLIEQGKSRSQIADCFFISENTVKYHVKNIFSKLGATSVTQALWLARVQGII
ncbi:MAG: hypothetical protein II070_07500 [Treponema sp.]|nr:hypothetical protein [Treponema sp.]